MDADALDNWQQQLDELVALEAIYGAEQFTFQGCDGFPGDAQLATLTGCEPPVQPWTTKVEVVVHLDLPSERLALVMDLDKDWGGVSSSGTEGADATGGNGSGSSPAPAASVPEDSPTGHNCVAVGHVQHLPPILVKLQLGCRYPSHEPPGISLQAIWLTPSQQQALKRQLQSQWDEQGAGYPICFSWLDFLKTCSLETISVGAALHLAPGGMSGQRPASSSTASGDEIKSQPLDIRDSHAEAPPGSSCDGPSCAQQPAPREAAYSGRPPLPAMAAHQLAMQLLHYSTACEQDAFDHSRQRCDICFDQLLGKHHLRLLECHHHFCRECLAQHCSFQVRCCPLGCIQQF